MKEILFNFELNGFNFNNLNIFYKQREQCLHLLSIFIICQDFDNFPVPRRQVSYTDLFTFSLERNGKH